MIDAVGSLVLNTPHLRGTADQVSAARSYAANPERIQETPKAPYISPYVFVDVYFDKAVLQIRDSETGDVLTQFPAENQLEQARQRAAQDRGVALPEPQADTAVESSFRRGDTPPEPVPEVVSAAPKKSTAPTPQQIDAFSAGAQTASPDVSSGAKVSVQA
ncbi:MAG: hypothetical protein H6862_03730 [Rhodospirillales bacterium]|nr:hypothetical protein [Rhodospirillales bacterium]